MRWSGAGAELHTLGGRLQQRAARLIQLTGLPHLGRAHISVARQARAGEAALLDATRRLDARADGCRRLAEPHGRQLLVLDARHVHVDVDAVEHGPADAVLVARDGGWRAGVAPRRVAVPAAWARMYTM